MADGSFVTRNFQAALTAASLDPETGLCEAVISTGAPVQRRGFLEILAIGPENVVFAPALPVLDSHRQGSISDTLGRVESIQHTPDGLIATLKISSQPARDAITRGDVTGVSIGYAVDLWADGSDPQGNPTRTAMKWRLLEVSLVAVPADPAAIIRSFPMEQIVQTRAAIREIARTAHLPPEWADAQIDADATVEAARVAANEARIARSQNAPQIRVIASHDDPAFHMRAREDALFARASGQAPTEQARQHMGDSLKDMARACLEAQGVATRGLSPDEIFSRSMHGTSDFPKLLTATGNRVLAGAYALAESPLKKLARQSTAPDFRPKSLLKLSDVGLLQPLSEHGEIRATSRAEVAEGYALDTYAAKLALSRKALVNDDLGAFGDFAQSAGRMAAETENKVLVDLLLSNPKLAETGKSLFHDDHRNKEGARLDDSGIGLDGMRAAFRMQKGLDGKTPINATARFLLVSTDLEPTVDTLMTKILDVNSAWRPEGLKDLELLVEPRLPAKSAYAFVDPARLACFEYSYLSSAQGPQIASQPDWDTLGMEFRVYLDFGAGAIDFRGAYQWA